jgi:hypothetical protein
MLRNRLRPITSQLFRSNHVVYVDDEAASDKLASIGERDVPTSTVILVDRQAANSLVSLVGFWNKRGNRPQTGTIYTSPKTFNVMEWSGGGKGTRKTVYIRYSMVQDFNTSKWIIHHLENTDEYISRKEEIEDDEAATASEESEPEFEEFFSDDEL